MRAGIELVERVGAVVAGVAVLFLFSDFPQNIEIAKKYETFAANCLVCTYFECICGKQEKAGQVNETEEDSMAKQQIGTEQGGDVKPGDES